VDEQRHLATRQMYRVRQYNFLPFEEMAGDIRKVSKSVLLYGKASCISFTVAAGFESVRYTGCSFVSKTK
jgi:hypothetical protein